MKCRCLLMLCALILLSYPLYANDTATKERLSFSLPGVVEFSAGPRYSVYFPVHGGVRDRFGDVWSSVGVSFALKNATRRSGVSYDLDFVSTKSGDDYAYLLPVGVSLRGARQGKGMRLYAGVGAGMAMTLVRVQGDGIDSEIRSTPAGSVFAGAELGRYVRLTARYNVMGKVAGLDFSGLKLSAGVQFE